MYNNSQSFYKNKELAEDTLRVDSQNAMDLSYWSVVLKSKPSEIKRAVKVVGTKVADVKLFLNPEIIKQGSQSCGFNQI